MESRFREVNGSTRISSDSAFSSFLFRDGEPDGDEHLLNDMMDGTREGQNLRSKRFRRVCVFPNTIAMAQMCMSTHKNHFDKNVNNLQTRTR